MVITGGDPNQTNLRRKKQEFRQEERSAGDSDKQITRIVQVSKRRKFLIKLGVGTKEVFNRQYKILE